MIIIYDISYNKVKFDSYRPHSGPATSGLNIQTHLN